MGAAQSQIQQFNSPHLLAFGVIFALWDAFGIGANDVANAFSTSVNSGVYTMAQVGVVVRASAGIDFEISGLFSAPARAKADEAP